jgi:hypothetical protein
MTAFVQAFARSPWRVALVFDATFGGMATPATYTFARVDGVGTVIAGSRAWNTDTLAVDLALTGPLLEGVIYSITAAGVSGSTRVAFHSPLAQVTAERPTDDPEAEAFGVDLDWLADVLDATGDIPTTRGRDCLRADLVAIALTEPGELVHRPDAGAGLDSGVNGPGDDPTESQAAVRREWLKDPRVRAVSVPAQISTAGDITINGNVTPIALNTSIPVTVHG